MMIALVARIDSRTVQLFNYFGTVPTRRIVSKPLETRMNKGFSGRNRAYNAWNCSAPGIVYKPLILLCFMNCSTIPPKGGAYAWHSCQRAPAGADAKALQSHRYDHDASIAL